MPNVDEMVLAVVDDLVTMGNRMVRARRFLVVMPSGKEGTLGTLGYLLVDRTVREFFPDVALAEVRGTTDRNSVIP
jgi:hypothetical protein